MRNPSVEKQLRLPRFPKRTFLLMVLALLVFIRFWCFTHPDPVPKAKPVEVELLRR